MQENVCYFCKPTLKMNVQQEGCCIRCSFVFTFLERRESVRSSTFSVILYVAKALSPLKMSPMADNKD
jgi:hypothetical protein